MGSDIAADTLSKTADQINCHMMLPAHAPLNKQTCTKGKGRSHLTGDVRPMFKPDDQLPLLTLPRIRSIALPCALVTGAVLTALKYTDGS
jgi:hypothetical protein